jgi:hypothetical protein
MGVFPFRPDHPADRGLTDPYLSGYCRLGHPSPQKRCRQHSKVRRQAKSVCAKTMRPRMILVLLIRYPFKIRMTVVAFVAIAVVYLAL